MSIFLALVGVVLIVTGVLSATGALPRNRWAGLRTRATLASDAAWRAGQRANAWTVIVEGALALAVAGWIAFTDPSPEGERNGVVALGAAVLVLSVIGIVRGNRAAAAPYRDEPLSPPTAEESA